MCSHRSTITAHSPRTSRAEEGNAASPLSWRRSYRRGCGIAGLTACGGADPLLWTSSNTTTAPRGSQRQKEVLYYGSAGLLAQALDAAVPHAMFGLEQKAFPALLGATLLALRGCVTPSIARGNTLNAPLDRGRRADVVLTNPYKDRA